MNTIKKAIMSIRFKWAFLIFRLSKHEMSKVWGGFAYKAGYKIVLKFDGKVLCGFRNTSMDTDVDMAESTTGASTNQWKEYVPMYKGMTFSVDGLYDPDTSDESVLDVLTLLKNGTKFTAIYGGVEVGDEYETADAYITNVGRTGDYTDLSGYTIGVQVTGEPTSGVVEA